MLFTIAMKKRGVANLTILYRIIIIIICEFFLHSPAVLDRAHPTPLTARNDFVQQGEQVAFVSLD